MSDIHYTSDARYCWVAFKSPRMLYYISLDSLEIKRSISLSVKPRKITVNPYNQFLYVLAGDLNAYELDNNIYVIDQYTGALVKKITVLPEPGGHPSYPTIYPYDIGFTTTGYGVILLQQDGSSGVDWRIIDSSLGDTIYFHEDHDNELHYYNFARVHLNFDQTKILLTALYGGCDIVILDGYTHESFDLWPGSLTRGVFITPDRMRNRVYFGQMYDQFIMDFEGNMSQISYIDNKNEGSADFTYLPGKENIIYFLDNDYLQILDYDNSITLMYCSAWYGMRGFTTSLDGVNAYACKTYNGTSWLWRFRTEDLWREAE